MEEWVSAKGKTTFVETAKQYPERDSLEEKFGFKFDANSHIVFHKYRMGKGGTKMNRDIQPNTQ